ncbi:MAG: NAD(+) synthase [Planctomycetaceae bacterium]
MPRHGFHRIAVCSPPVHVADPARNATAIVSQVRQVGDADVVVFPELCLTGYTCGDLFRHQRLLDAALDALLTVCAATRGTAHIVVVGMPLAVGPERFNAAVLLQAGAVRGVVPKTAIPTYGEFYESRWFRGAGEAMPAEIILAGQRVPFGTDLVFTAGPMAIALEICEDLWLPIPPSSHAALAGANVLLNLSASNETVAKHDYRRALVANQSARCVAAYAYAAAGPDESTTDLVFGGHCLVAENGRILVESPRVGLADTPARGGWHVRVDVDLERLDTERRSISSFGEAARTASRRFRTVALAAPAADLAGLERPVDGRPFVPREPATLAARCAEVFGIQCAGLARRLEHLGWPAVHLGVSGGLDSTLALLVAAKTFAAAGRPPAGIHGLALPGFGTTARTSGNARKLMAALGVTASEIDIRPLCLATFRSLGHRPFGIDPADLDIAAFEGRLARLPADARHDLVFENVQARQRTLLLMSQGFVIGTGDLSELALGWCTYGGDHLSMYGVNAGVPKSLVRFLVEHVAATEHAGTPLEQVLRDVAATTISPELLPRAEDGGIAQATEDYLGPYELHDFFLWGFVRCGFGPEKILFLSDHADFSRPYPRAVRERTLVTFLRRFFAHQFKRSALPDGPKVGSVSLSPRGDWRMPSDADAGAWLGGG